MAKRVVPGTTVPIPKLDFDEEPTPVRDGVPGRDYEDEVTIPRDQPLGMRARTPTQSLLVSPFFAPLPADLRGAVLERFAKRSVAAGETVIRQGETSHPLVIVTRGRLDIRVERANGQLVQVGSIATGEYIGEAALLSRSAASAHVVASTDAELLTLPPSDFYEVVGAFPALWAELEDDGRASYARPGPAAPRALTSARLRLEDPLERHTRGARGERELIVERVARALLAEQHADDALAHRDGHQQDLRRAAHRATARRKLRLGSSCVGPR